MRKMILVLTTLLLTLATTKTITPAKSQEYIPYGYNGPMYQRDYQDYRSGNGSRWYTAPQPRSGYYPYYPSLERQRQYPQYQQGARPFLPGQGYFGPLYRGW